MVQVTFEDRPLPTKQRKRKKRACKGRRYWQPANGTHERMDGRKKWIGGSQGVPGGWEGRQNSALCVASETPVFMTLLGHNNDAHCIVLHVKRTLTSRPGLKSALAQRRQKLASVSPSPFSSLSRSLHLLVCSSASRSSFFHRAIIY